MWKFVLKRVAVFAVTIVVIAALVFTLTWERNDPAEIILAKPVIYLYPEQTAEVDVTLELDGELVSSWPAYADGWHVTAQPDGVLTDADGNEYSYLFWDALSSREYDFSQGFCVAGADTGDFLRRVLSDMGLTPREYNEFIVYWLPLMQESPYNLISFQGEAYEESAKLHISPEPDSILRVFMAWKRVEEPVDITVQSFAPFTRQGFTVVEWGGCQVTS